MLVAARAPSVPIAAVLPEVLRCGTRYARFRARLVDAGLAGRFTSRGRFDAWTDVDVFTTLLEFGGVRSWQSPSTFSATVGDRFTVSVGPVVPHRHAHIGPWYRFACVRSRDRYSMYSQYGNTISRVLNRWRHSPFTQVSTSMSDASSSPTTMHGPSEHDWSKFFAMPNLSGPWGSLGALMLQSPRRVTPQTRSLAWAARTSFPCLPRTIATSPS